MRSLRHSQYYGVASCQLLPKCVLVSLGSNTASSNALAVQPRPARRRTMLNLLLPVQFTRCQPFSGPPCTECTRAQHSATKFQHFTCHLHPAACDTCRIKTSKFLYQWCLQSVFDNIIIRLAIMTPRVRQHFWCTYIQVSKTNV